MVQLMFTISAQRAHHSAIINKNMIADESNIIIYNTITGKASVVTPAQMMAILEG